MRNLLDVPVLFLHGDKDQRIPSSASVSTYDELRGLKPRVAPEYAHPARAALTTSLWRPMTATRLPFFERFTRDPFPQNCLGDDLGP